MKMVLEAEPQHQTPIWERLITAAMEEAADRNAYMAYPAEAHQEDVFERGPIDDPTGDSGQPVPGTELLEAEEMEQEELDQFVLPGMTDAEQLRKKEWLQIPRQARQALRRLHHMLGHKPEAVMRQVLKAGGAPPEQLAGVELFHCDKCEEAVPPLRLHPVKAPARYTFNHDVLIDVLEAKDATGERFPFFRSCATAPCSMLSSWSGQVEEHHRRVSARPSSRRAGLPGPAGLFVSPVTAECITGECSHRYYLHIGCT